MIGRLRGEVIEGAVGRLVVDVHGVGYVVQVTATVAFAPGTTVDLHIHTAVRDDAITLYGFSNREEKELFDLLLGVPGVGPAKAMGILQTPVSNFVEMVARREPAALAKLPGVGKKTAERILVDLSDKIAALGGVPASMPVRAVTGGATSRIGRSPIEADLVSALVNLGYKEGTAAELAQAALSDLGPDVALEVLLKEALARTR